MPNATRVNFKTRAEKTASGYMGVLHATATRARPSVSLSAGVPYTTDGIRPEFSDPVYQPHALGYERTLLSAALEKIGGQWTEFFSSLKPAASRASRGGYEAEKLAGRMSIYVEDSKWVPESWLEAERTGTLPDRGAARRIEKITPPDGEPI